MKKVLPLVLLGLLCLNGYAQDRKNVAKILPANLALNSLSFEYERMLNTKNSLELSLGLPMKSAFISRFSIDEDEVSNDKLGVFFARAAYRHYTGKSSLPKGFYLAPYLKYQAINGSIRRLSSIDDEEMPASTSYTEDFDAKISTFGAGLQLGYQFLIAKRVTVDFYFLGIEGGFGNFNMSITSSDPEKVSGIKSDLEDSIADLPSFWNKKIDVTSSGNTVRAKATSLPYPWLRTGISIGIAF